VRSGCEDGNVGALSMADTTCVIPSCASCVASFAVARQVRYRRGATLLATRLLFADDGFAAADRWSGFMSNGCWMVEDRRAS
jgi:hypothetical protein